jgi:hypothetical protein
MPTHIKNDKETGVIGYSNNDLDHFGYDENNKQFTGRTVDVIRCDVPYNDFGKYKTNISDHVPIRLELNINPRRL